MVKERNKASKDGECWGRTEKETRMKLLERITMEGPMEKVACEQRLKEGEGGGHVERERGLHALQGLGHSKQRERVQNPQYASVHLG